VVFRNPKSSRKITEKEMFHKKPYPNTVLRILTASMGFERTSMVPSPAGSLGKRIGDPHQAGIGMGGTGLTIAARSNHGEGPHGVSASLAAARQFSFLAKRLWWPASSRPGRHS
jgi:hypothetical protein